MILRRKSFIPFLILVIILMTTAVLVHALSTEDEVLSPTNGEAGFGRSLDVEGDKLVVSSNNKRISVYQHIGGNWVFSDTFTVATPSSVLAYKVQVAANGDIAMADPTSNRVHLYQNDGGGYVLAQTIIGLSNDFDISMSGDTLFIGDAGDDSIAINAGSVHIYRYDEGSNSWYRESVFTGSLPPQPGRRMGWPLDVYGDKAVVLASGSQTYLLQKVGGDWVETAVLPINTQQGQGGYALSQTQLAVTRHDDNGGDVGIYEWDGTTFVHTDTYQFPTAMSTGEMMFHPTKTAVAIGDYNSDLIHILAKSDTGWGLHDSYDVSAAVDSTGNDFGFALDWVGEGKELIAGYYAANDFKGAALTYHNGTDHDFFADTCGINLTGTVTFSDLQVEVVASVPHLLNSIAGQLNNPVEITQANNKIYVSSNGNGKIREFDLNGNYLGTFADLNSPAGLTADPDGNIYVGFAVQPGTEPMIRKYDNAGNTLTEWGG